PDGVHRPRSIEADAPLVQGAGVSPRGLERPLHRDREPEHRGAIDLGKSGDLEGLDAMPPRAEVPSFTGVEPPVDPLPRPEHLLDRAIADRVHADLQAVVVPVAEEALEDLVVEG